MDVALDFVSCLKSKRRLERDKGLSQLRNLLSSNSLSAEVLKQLQETFLSSLSSTSTTWEEKHGALMATILLLPVSADQWAVRVRKELPQLLQHKETRVGAAAGELLSQLCCQHGVSVYCELETCIIAGIHDNLERDFTSADPELVEKLGRSRRSSEGSEGEDEEQERPGSPGSAQVFHDTAGWKSLETYMNALQRAVEGCGHSFSPHITGDLLQLLFTALQHTNRFVRETAYNVIAAIVSCPGIPQCTLDTHWSSVTMQLATGLADNWSQVRMAASVATRQFLLHLEPSERKAQYLPTLLPPMCLNRYYVAEGVKLYSQETWRLVTEGRGVKMVEENISAVVQFYVQQSEAANHAVREAACACIAELGSKMNKDCLRPYVPQLVSTLIDCFKDDSWPVRDSACLACGNFITCFPDECSSYLNKLFDLFLANLEDSIPSVRQGAAVTMAAVVKAYGGNMKERVIGVVRERLPLVAQQPDTSDESSPQAHHPGIDPSPAVFGVVRRTSESDIEAHSNQQMYSCGSLAPKMKRGGGCMDSHFHKPAQLWEKSEGCVHLLAELSKVKDCEQAVSTLLPMLADTTQHKQYRHHYNLFETILKQIPVISRSLGKRLFKRYLELFFDPLFYSISAPSGQLRAAAVDCLSQLTQQLGRNIVRGRVEQHNPTYLQLFDQHTSTTPQLSS